MPSWKKVIVSGSDAVLNSLNITTALTASGLIYPTTDGLTNQSIITDGAGNLIFGNPYSDNTVVYGKNLSGVTILKGTPLYFTGSGTSGNLVGVFPADASNPARMPAGGIAGEQLLDEAEGVVLLDGFISGVNTSAFNSGDLVYVAVGGGYTNVAPTGSTNLIQTLGYVEKSAVNGSGVIKGPGVFRSVPNIQQGYTWVGNADDVATPVATSSIQNVVSSSYATTASFSQTASYVETAQTASYVLNAVSASFAATASSVIGTVESASYAITASILVNHTAKVSASSAVYTSGSSLLYDLSEFKGAMVDYVVSTSGSGTSARAGTFTAVWNSVFSSFNESTTMDIGNTDAVHFSADSTGSIFINVTSGSWEVDSLYRALGTATISTPPAPTSITVNFYSTGTDSPLVALTCASTSSYSVQIFGDPGNDSPTFCGPDELLAIDITNILAGGHSIPVGSTFYLASGGQVRTWIRPFDSNIAYWHLDSCQACPATTTTTTTTTTAPTTTTTTTTTVAPITLITYGATLATCSDYCVNNYNINTVQTATADYDNLTIGDTIFGLGGLTGYIAYSNISTDTTTGPFKVAQVDSSGTVIGITVCSGGSCVPI
jgi:hypothetical protein